MVLFKFPSYCLIHPKQMALKLKGFFNLSYFFPNQSPKHIWSSFICITRKGTKRSFTENDKPHFQYLKCTLSFVGSQFISLNSLAPASCLTSSFKQKRIHLVCVIFILFLISWLTKVNQEIDALPNCGWSKELHNNLRNFGFRKLFYLFPNGNFVLIFLRDFIAI